MAPWEWKAGYLNLLASRFFLFYFFPCLVFCFLLFLSEPLSPGLMERLMGFAEVDMHGVHGWRCPECLDCWNRRTTTWHKSLPALTANSKSSMLMSSFFRLSGFWKSQGLRNEPLSRCSAMETDDGMHAWVLALFFSFRSFVSDRGILRLHRWFAFRLFGFLILPLWGNVIQWRGKEAHSKAEPRKKKKKEREISVMVFHRTISSNLNCLNGLGIHGEMPGLSKGSPSACPHNPQPALSSRVEDDGTKHLHDARKQIKKKKLEGGLWYTTKWIILSGSITLGRPNVNLTMAFQLWLLQKVGFSVFFFGPIHQNLVFQGVSISNALPRMGSNLFWKARVLLVFPVLSVPWVQAGLTISQPRRVLVCN